MGLRPLAAAVAIAVLAASCSLPSDGPTTGIITDKVDPEGPASPFVVVKLDANATNVAGQYMEPSFSSYFRVNQGLPEITLEVGDVIAINIFEAGADGLFSSSTAKATQIQTTIDQGGQVFVPYVGAVRAAGTTVASLRRRIESSLEDKAIQPQVQISVTSSLANSVSVLGTVANPGVYPIALSGQRVLDVVAAAGGSSSQTFETRVILRRKNEVASANLEQLFDHPEEDVVVSPGDTILLSNIARTFTAFGATGATEEFPFTSRRVTLAEALARAGGLDDARADAHGVFVFRFEPDHIAKALNERAITAPEGSKVPVVYRINMRDPNAFFLAQQFNMRDEDILYVSNHPTVALSKFLQLLAPLVSTTTTVATLTTRFDNN